MSKSVIAKFHVHEVLKERATDLEGKPCNQYSIRAFPVYQGSEEDKKFFNATPGGSLYLCVLNEAAGVQFKQGSDIYVTIEQVEKPEEQSNGFHAVPLPE